MAAAAMEPVCCPALTSACAELIYAKGHLLTLFNNTGPSRHSHDQHQSQQRSTPIPGSCHFKPEARSCETRARRLQHQTRTSNSNTQRHFRCKKQYSFLGLDNYTAHDDDTNQQCAKPSSNEPNSKKPDLPFSRTPRPKHHGRQPSHDPQINVRRPQPRSRRPRSHDRKTGTRNNKATRIPLLPLQNARPAIPRPPRPPHRQLLTTQITPRALRSPRLRPTRLLRPTSCLRMLRAPRGRAPSTPIPRHLLPRERRRPSQFRPTLPAHIPTTGATARPTRLDAAITDK
jgi:hypothetical protein